MDCGPVLVSPHYHTSLGCVSTSVGTGSEKCWEGRCGRQGPWCYSSVLS